MNTIKRASREAGSWSWSVPCAGEPAVREMLSTAQSACDLLIEMRIMRPEVLQVLWSEKGVHRGEKFSLEVPEGLGLTDCADVVADSAPPWGTVMINYMAITGKGTVKRPDESDIAVNSLVELNLLPFGESFDIELTIHHDFWFPYSFDGSPQLQKYKANAPRLALVLDGIENRIQQETEPGDRTFFGQPEKSGIRPPENDLIIDGRRIEVTDMGQVGWEFQEYDEVSDGQF